LSNVEIEEELDLDHDYDNDLEGAARLSRRLDRGRTSRSGEDSASTTLEATTKT